VTGHSLELLEYSLFNTMINISDIWFIEMAGGDAEHSFDLGVTCKATRTDAYFNLHKLIAQDGISIDAEVVENAEAKEATITVRGLMVSDPVTLAVRLSRRDAPMWIDLKIDGEPAIHRTFVGGSLTNPGDMPFRVQDSPDEEPAETKPTHKPEPPYFLVWLSKPAHGGDTTIELDDQTEKELRSLGYIQ
jgi:hypothetical protein